MSLKNSYFSETELASLLPHEIPRHVAIIMDGNRRWAKKRVFSQAAKPFSGHLAGAEAITAIVEAAQELGIKVVTLYAFSTENWLRSQEELSSLFSLFETFLKENRLKMIEQGVHFEAIGHLEPFPESLKEEIYKTTLYTEKCDKITLLVALNYGSRDEICRAVKKIFHEVRLGKLKEEEINEETLSQYLDTAPFGDPELLIRTSGEMRVSNFLLWQLAYTEFYVTDVLWPDFTPRELFNAVLEFQKRPRRLGR